MHAVDNNKMESPGKCLVFDDCYEHEVWNKTEGERVLLLFDLWHPDLVEEVRPVCFAFFFLMPACVFVHSTIRVSTTAQHRAP